MSVDLICFCVAIVIISLGCLLPSGVLPILPHDKLLHFLAFGGLTLIAAHIAADWEQLRYWLLGLVVAGWLIEVLQIWVPGRNFCWRDMGANVAGIAVAAGCAHLTMSTL